MNNIPLYIKNIQPVYSNRRSVLYHGLLNNNPVAVKNVPKRYSMVIDNVFAEVNIMQQLQGSKNVVRYIDMIENDTDIYIVMEWINGMNIREFMQINNTPLSEQRIKEIIYPLAEILRMLNDMNMVYGDVKPDNIMIQPSGDIKLIDFGCTRKIGTVHNNYIGTPMYFSPEMYDQVFLPQYDVWGIGIIIYYLASGKHPFVRTLPIDMTDLRNMIQTKPLVFDDPIWEGWTNEGKDLIMELLEKDPFKRLDICSLCKHKWFDGISRADD